MLCVLLLLRDERAVIFHTCTEIANTRHSYLTTSIRDLISLELSSWFLFFSFLLLHFFPLPPPLSTHIYIIPSLPPSHPSLFLRIPTPVLSLCLPFPRCIADANKNLLTIDEKECVKVYMNPADSVSTIILTCHFSLKNTTAA